MKHDGLKTLRMIENVDRLSYLSNRVGINVFEDLVKTKLETALGRVSKKCWGPAFAQFANACILQRYFEALNDVSILGRIHLDATLYKVKRNNCCMCDATAEDSTKPT